MKLRTRRQVRFTRVPQVALGVATAALAAAGVARPAHADLFFDDLTATENGTGGALSSSGATNNTYLGAGVILSIPATTTGTPQFAGFDVLPYNNTAYNFSSLRITYNLFGTVNGGTVNASNPAFSNQLVSSAGILTVTGGLAPGYFVRAEGNGSSPFFSLNNPVALNGLTNNRVGVSINVQGAQNGSSDYFSYQGLQPLLTYNASPTTGSLISPGYYAGTNGETNGNFTSGVRPTGTAFLSVGTRIFGGNIVRADHAWAAAADDVWTDPFAWFDGVVPASADSATFDNSATTPYTVTIPPGISVGDVFVRNDRVRFDLSTAPTATADGSELDIGRTLTVGQAANGSTGTVNGALTITNSSNVKFNVVRAGSIAIGGNGSTGSLTVGPYVVPITAGATTIAAGSTLTLSPKSAFLGGVVTLAGTTNAWTSKFDVSSAPVALAGASLATITNYAKVGAANGTFTGQGITSSIAAASAAHLLAVGVIQNNQNGTAIYGGLSTDALQPFDGDLGVTPTDILIRLTYYGDANLDGAVNASDYALIDAGFVGKTTGWLNGDFNYDGIVDGSDYALMDNAFNHQSAKLDNNVVTGSLGRAGMISAAGGINNLTLIGGTATAEPLGGSLSASPTAAVAAVPEPIGTAALLFGAATLAAGRRRRTR